jgi:hypothetical protein
MAVLVFAILLLPYISQFLWREPKIHAACRPIALPNLGRQAAVLCSKTVAL